MPNNKAARLKRAVIRRNPPIKKPRCKHIREMFDPVFSYENGAGAFYICMTCGRRREEKHDW